MDENDFKKIDVNRAEVEELTQITGIGEGLAQRIVEYRETVHPFEEVIELAAVPGISERMVRNFADQVTVEPVAVMEKTTVSVPHLALEDIEPAPEAAEALAEVEETALAEVSLADVFEETEADLAPEAPTIDEAEPGAEPEAEPEAERLEAAAPIEEEMELEPEMAWETAVPEPETIVAEPVSERETLPVTEPTPLQPAAKPERPLGAILLGSILGAFVGAILTLAILAVLNNGTLLFTRADARLRSELEDARQAQDDLSLELEGVNSQFTTNLGAVATRAGDLMQQQQEAGATIKSLGETLETTQGDVADLEEAAQELDERLTNVAEAAESFDTFLDRMRDLLIELQGTPEPTMTPTATPTAADTATPTPAENEAGQATAVPTSTGRPTRTPRPTATPIPLATLTPSQQP